MVLGPHSIMDSAFPSGGKDGGSIPPVGDILLKIPKNSCKVSLLSTIIRARGEYALSRDK